MTRVDYYILSSSEPDDKLHFACRLAEKAYRSGHKVYIHTSNEEDARHIDDQLWAFKPESFVPHNLISEPHNTIPPVQIGHSEDPGHHHDVLINLSKEVPQFFSRFNRLAEIVINHDTDKEPSRQRYRFYQERGYPLSNHKIA